MSSLFFHVSLHYDHQTYRSIRSFRFPRSLAGATHSFAVILSALSWAALGPVQVGVRSQAQIHHTVTDLGCWGAAIYSAISGGSARNTQSPEQGGGCLCLPKLLDVCWPPRHQLMLAMLPLWLPECDCFQWLCLVAGFLTLPATLLPLSARPGVAAHILLR